MKLVNPLVISKEREQDPINLLLIEGEETNHYCWIKNKVHEACGFTFTTVSDFFEARTVTYRGSDAGKVF